VIADAHDRRRQKREGWALFEAEAAYADSIFRSAIGDTERCIHALERAVEISPGYAPAVLALGSVEYQRNRKAKGRRLLLSLVSVVDDAPDGTEIIDAAGDFLIQRGEYADGLELYRAAVQRFPDVGVFHQGRGCCAAHEGEFREAVAASRRALAIEPDNQKFVNDLGWCLAQSGALQEALATLERAVAMDPADELARENLRLCNLKIAKRRRKKLANSRLPMRVSASLRGTS
jgi:Flp pilus assembly protein TadD